MSGLQVTWKKMGAEFGYDVMYSKTSEGPWIVHNDFRLTDISIEKLIRRLENEEENPISSPYNPVEDNVYILDSLESNQTYYIKIRCYDKYNKWWYSYNSPGSIDGGLSEPNNRPNPNGGNSLGFQFSLVI